MIAAYKIPKVVSLVLTSGTVCSAVITFYALHSRGVPSQSALARLDKLIWLDVFFIAALSALLLYNILRMMAGVRRGIAGGSLQSRVISRFCLVALLPAAIVTIFSAIFFNYGIKSWFDERVSTALESSTEVAEAYLKEHVEILRADATAMAGDLNREIGMAYSNPKFFSRIVSGQAALRSLTEAVVISGGRIIAQTDLSFSLSFDQLPREAFDKAREGEVAVLPAEQGDRVRAVVALDSADTYLVTGRFIDARVLEYMQGAKGAVAEYVLVKSRIEQLQRKVLVLFTMFSVLMVLLAVHYGVKYSGQLIRPIGKLIIASEKIKDGDFTARIEVGSRKDEISNLARSFNRMAAEIEEQRQKLMDSNHLLESRRFFIETVLSGISAGVIALDHNLGVTLINPQACNILGLEEASFEGVNLADILPEFSLIARDAASKARRQEQEITLNRAGRVIMLLVRAVPDATKGEPYGAIITFDDITGLVSAKRSAAWSDIARRVAHEMKNPLTPIQLSAERLKRKFEPTLHEEKESFNKYLDTITRHVKDIGRMVEEFVGFARMPAPRKQAFNIVGLARRSIFTQETAAPEVAFHLEAAEPEIIIEGDEGHIGQVFTNLLKNAAEALTEEAAMRGADFSPAIHMSIQVIDHHCRVEICDNGRGYPQDMMHRLTEPYVTTKEKGTGLGLAIVKKIIEEHGGELKLENQPQGGAKASFAIEET